MSKYECFMSLYVIPVFAALIVKKIITQTKKNTQKILKKTQKSKINKKKY